MAFEKDSFYLFLSSDSSEALFPDNVKSSFSTQLAKPVRLDPNIKWGVGLAELIVRGVAAGPSARSAGAPSRRQPPPPASPPPPRPVIVHNSNALADGVMVALDDDVSWGIFADKSYTLDTFYAENVDGLDRAGRFAVRAGLLRGIENEMLRSNLTPGGGSSVAKEALVGIRFNNVVVLCNGNTFEDVEALLFSFGEHLASLTEYRDFLTQLRDKITLEEAKDVISRRARQVPSGGGAIYIYLDILEPLRVGDSFAKLLRIASGESDHYTFTDKFYMPVQVLTFSTVSVMLASRLGERYPFPDGDSATVIVLHFVNMERI